MSFKDNYLISLGYDAKIIYRKMSMKLKERISWLMGAVVPENWTMC